MVSEKEILGVLSQIIDPDFQRDIVSLGFVQNLKIDEGTVSFEIELTTPACPLSPQFKKQAEGLVGALPGVGNVNVTMTARKRAPHFEQAESGLGRVKNIIAVSSCKGGVGKSTVAALIARTLAGRGIKTGLLDADIYGPSLPTLFNLHHPKVYSNQQQRILPVEADGLKLMSFAFLTGDGPTVLRGPLVSQYIQQLLHNVEWGGLDVLVLDLPPGTGDIQLTISQSIRIDGAVIVTTPHQLSLTDVRKGIQMFEKVNVPVLGVVENMAWFACDECSKKHYPFGTAGAKSLEEKFGLETLAELPISPNLQLEYAEETADAVIRALGRQTLENQAVPEVSFDATHITLRWPDETVRVENTVLRKACSCALCIDEMTQKPILDPADVPDDIHAEKVGTIGNYAITVDWSDGHNTGFFPYKTIRELSIS
ncbi:P-loop NTPase [Tichowtungia aerotolerans]|uniref:Iron-sulfur cluster carrier protein n=1 Tax=Tichowtungia aerotolerans TaxID=2697043 RepID=A0A6P1M7C3_9BACT|nr:P-loop NTPase [Tichowtungia aerotolerans]QHI69757.1 P-loop NTPase [Tichowtungia aerotolerans]